MVSVKEVLKKKATGRPKHGYYTSDGKRCVGVTTVAKMIEGGSNEGLLYWAINLERQGIDYRDARDDAAAQGTAIHDAVELVLSGKTVDEAVGSFKFDHQDAVRAGLTAFLEWKEHSQLNLHTFEQPLVSDEYAFGGTADLLGRDTEGRMHLADIKSGSLRPAAVLQVAAYRHLIEKHLDEKIVGCHLLRFDREEGAFTHVGIPDSVMSEAWEAFLHCRSLYEFGKRIKKML